MAFWTRYAAAVTSALLILVLPVQVAELAASLRHLSSSSSICRQWAGAGAQSCLRGWRRAVLLPLDQCRTGELIDQQQQQQPLCNAIAVAAVTQVV
jgi:hypothetical protein